MTTFQSQDAYGTSLNFCRKEGHLMLMESSTIYYLDVIAEQHAKSTSRKERRELADQYAVAAESYNKLLNFKAFKPAL